MPYRVRKDDTRWVILDDNNVKAGFFSSKSLADKVTKQMNKAIAAALKEKKASKKIEASKEKEE
jgi:hypothetical protein|tara:strand:- start:965 stop:1156 length:192 start_codon:yes stop_codon:yes gene_type:complete